MRRRGLRLLSVDPPPFFHCFSLLTFLKQGKVDSFMDTPGPLSICLTNMVIVFAVLIFLAFVIELIHVVDPTKGKKK